MEFDGNEGNEPPSDQHTNPPPPPSFGVWTRLYTKASFGRNKTVECKLFVNYEKEERVTS